MPTNKNFKMLTSCEEARHVCDKSQYKEASLMEKIKLSIHVLHCRACQKYTVNNNKLTKVMKKEKIETLNLSEKSEMDQLFQEQLKNS